MNLRVNSTIDHIADTVKALDITKSFSNHNTNVLSDRDMVSKIFRESDAYRKALDMIMGDNQLVLAVKKIDNTFGEYQKLISQFMNSLQSEYDKLRILISHGQDAMVHIGASDFGIRELRIPDQSEPPFRSKPNPDSGASRTPIPG